MRSSVLVGLVAVIVAVSAGTSRAAVTLPSANDLRFEGMAAYNTSFQPFINVETGELIGALPTDLPLELFAFGQVNSILDLNNSLNKGSISGELTMTYTGAEFTPISVGVASTDNSVVYTITSTVSGGVISMYDDATADLNTAGWVGQPAPATPPGEATDGTLYLQANSPADTTGMITIAFLRATPESDFSSFEIRLQQLNGGEFNITGGSILEANPDLLGKALQASQDGVFSSNFDVEEVQIPVGEGTVTVRRNAAVNTLLEGDFVANLSVIPEPASVALLALGSLVLFSGRRQWRSAR